MSAALKNYTIEKGASWALSFVWRNKTTLEPVGLSIYDDIRLECRIDLDDAPFISYLRTDTNSAITTVDEDGKVVINLSPAITETMPDVCYYRIEALKGDTVTRLLKGTLTLDVN